MDVDTDALDEDPNTAHIYVTYDSPASNSRHTLAVARIVLDADPTARPRAFAKATRLLSTAAAQIPGDSSIDNFDNIDKLENPGTGTGLGGVGDYGALRACVDRFAATGRAS